MEKAKQDTNGKQNAPATGVLIATGISGMTWEPRQSPATKCPSR